jgi:hypothetical protein
LRRGWRLAPGGNVIQRQAARAAHLPDPRDHQWPF